MLDGGIIPEHNSLLEQTFLLIKRKRESIEEIKFHLLTKSIIMSGLDVESYNKQLKIYNELLVKLNNLVYPEQATNTKSFVKDKMEFVKNMKNMKISDILDPTKLRIGKKIKGKFEKTISQKENWSKVDGN